MRALGLAGVLLGLAATAAVASCVVSSFDEVDVLPGADSGAGGTSGSGGAGGSGGTTDSGTCGSCSPPAGGKACCFEHPTKGSVCGNDVGTYGAGCLPLDNPGAADPACPEQSAFKLPGCCTPSGTCGYLDAANGLGCIPAEALGGSAVACGAPSCGSYCDSSCKSGAGSLPFFSCAEKCMACEAQVKTLLAAPCTPSSGCTTSGEKYYSGCLNPNYQLASCRNDPDCGRYCNMVMEACVNVDQKQYESLAMCEKTCAALPPGTFGAAEDSVACRMQRTVTAQCPAAGPATTTACGGTCHAYCTLMKAACASEFTNQFQNDAACESWCTGKASPANFSWGNNAAHPVNCRIEQLVKGLSGQAITCTELGNTTGGLCG